LRSGALPMTILDSIYKYCNAVNLVKKHKLMWNKLRTSKVVLPEFKPIEQHQSECDNGQLSTLPSELLIRIISFASPNDNLLVLSRLNTYWYIICAQQLIWKRYFWSYAFEPHDIVPTAVGLAPDDWRGLYKHSFLPVKFHPIRNLSLNKSATVATNSSKTDLFATFGDDITTGVHYYRIVFSKTKFGSMCGIVEQKNLLNINEHNCVAYFRDGSMSIPDGDCILDRVKEVEGNKKYKVYYEVEDGDVLGLKIDIEGQLVTVFVNGEERLHVKMTVREGDVFKMFCRMVTLQSFSLLRRMKTVEEYENNICLEKTRKSVSTARVNKSC
jgi:hypothetical protein